MDVTTFQSDERSGECRALIAGVGCSDAIDARWPESGASALGLTSDDFRNILISVGRAKNFGCSEDQPISRERQEAFFDRLRISDLLLARACALGKPIAWDRFLTLYRQPLIRAAIKITHNETLGHDLAESLSGELYGLAVRDGVRQSPLNSYLGTGPLLGWLCTILAQRHIGHLRHTHRERPLNDYDAPAVDSECTPTTYAVTTLAEATQEAVRLRTPEERFLLAAYYLDGRRLRQIAAIERVSEASISRRLKHLRDDLRKQILRNLQRSGLSKREAEEALETDPRDLDIDLGKLLSSLRPGAFHEENV